MQSSLHIPSEPSRIPQSPWKFPKSRPHPSPQALIFPSSLKSPPSKFDLKETIGGDEVAPAMIRLPIVIRKAGMASRFVWDGDRNRLQLVPFDQDGKSLEKFEFGDQLRSLVWISCSAVRKLFVPRQVHANYMDYLKWKLLHRVSSSTLQVLATQALFRAIGIGSSRSLPSAAALNWVLKDGVGRLSRCIYTASLGSAFDTNLKRIRFSTSILFSVSVGVELLTPLFPQYFLLLATIANIAKSISLAAYIATGSAIHRSFAVADNLGEVSAKAQIQTVCFDNMGLMLAALLNILCKNSQRLLSSLPLVAYPIFTAVDLFAIYQGLQHVHLQTLTKDRLEIIIDIWIQSGFVPSPAEVSYEEGIFPSRKGRKLWPIRIGCINVEDLSPKFSLLTIQSLSSEDFYFICTETSYRRFTRKQQQGIVLCLRESARTIDIVMGLLQACFIRKSLTPSTNMHKHEPENGNICESILGEWFKVVKDSKRFVQEEVNLLMEDMQRAGWAIKNILLNTQEQIRYSLLDD